MYLAKTPEIVKPLANNLIWNGDRTQKKIYLTFDDGPIPGVTPYVLECLAKYKAEATFFMVGENVRKYPEIFEEIKTKGHKYGNHTYNHLNGWNTSTFRYGKNTLQADALIQSPLFRPPYGRFTRKQSNQLRARFTIIMWDVIAGDFDQSISSERVFNNITQNTQNGSIIVMHDSQKAWKHLKNVLPKALDWLTEQGYEMASLPMNYWHPAKHDLFKQVEQL